MELNSIPNEFEKCDQILSAALEYELERFKGGIVFDGRDPFIEAHNKTLTNVSKLQKSGKLDKLKQMLEALILKYRGDAKFAEFVFQRSGYKIKTFPDVYESVINVRNVSVHTSGKGIHSLTYVVVQLRGGSGSIYSIRGRHPNLKAYWKDDHTIVIEVPQERKDTLRYMQVSSFGHVVNIEYLEI
jgi:hypothetical protein